MYLAKLEEEANYFTVTDTNDSDTDICTCHTCIVSCPFVRLQVQVLTVQIFQINRFKVVKVTTTINTVKSFGKFMKLFNNSLEITFLIN